MDEKELQAVGEALEQLRAGGTVSAETLAKLGGTAQSANQALEGYTKKILGATSAIGGMARQVADGEGSFKSLGGAIGGLTSVVGKLAGAIPLVGGAAKALAEGVGEAAKFVLDQLDTMAKNYQTLGDASAGAADGVDGLMRQFNQMGNFSLPAFTRAVKSNMAGLMAFKGTAAEGAEELSKIAGVLTTEDTARQFLKLGIGLDAVGDAAAAYTANFGRMGLTQGLTTDELVKKTQYYILEVDKIARITGQSREEQQKAQQQLMADARARAVLGQMGRSGQAVAAKELSTLMGAFDEATNAAIRATATGIPLTDQAQKANLFTNDQIRQTTMAVKSGAITALEGTARIRQALAQGAETFAEQVSYAGPIFGGVEVAGEDAAATLRTVAELKQQKEYAGLSDTELVTKAQEIQRKASGQLTEDLTNAQLATAGASKDLQSLGFSLAVTGVSAVNKFATALESVTGYINKNFGVGGTKSTPAGVDRGVPGGPRAATGSAGASVGGNRQALLDLIGKGESGGNYNALVYGKKGANVPGQADLTNMTIAQVQEYQKGMIAQGHASTAVGKYQMIAKTLEAQVKKAGLDPSTTKFDQKTQDLLANQLVDQAGFGKKSQDTVMKNLAGTFASLPKDMSGRGAYDNYNQNKATISAQDLATVLGSPERGLVGPRDRYQTSINGVSYDAAGRGVPAQAPQTQTQQDEKTGMAFMAQQLAQIEYNTRNSARAQEKGNRIAQG